MEQFKHERQRLVNHKYATGKFKSLVGFDTPRPEEQGFTYQ